MARAVAGAILSAAPVAQERPPWKHPPSPTADDLASLLTEFDASTAKPSAGDKGKNPVAEQSKPLENVDPVIAAMEKALGQGAVTQEMRNHLGTYGNVVSRLFQHQIQQQNKNDFANIVSIGNQRLKDAGIHVGEDFVERWFAAEANLDRALCQSFDLRYESPQHLRQYEKLAERSMGRLMKSASSQIDQEVTEDKLAVVAALKGASISAMPPEPPVSYSSLSNSDLANEWAKVGG